MSDDLVVDALGRCWAFPPQFSVETGVKMAEGIDSVLQSLRVLFMTEPGERIMRESYGAGMSDFIFENITDDLLAKIKNRIEESVLRNEDRAEIKNVLIQPAKNDVSRLRVQITFQLLASNIVETLEGTLSVNEVRTLRLL